MKAIEQASLALLSVSLSLLVLVIGLSGFDSYMTRPVSYAQPQWIKEFSYVKSVRDATSLADVKRICSLLAEHQDKSEKAFATVQSEQQSFMRNLVLWVVAFGTIFSIGLLYIYFTARRLRLAQENAL